MCDHCYRGRCERCTGCWHETEHDFSDRDGIDDGYDEDRATDRYEKFYDRMFGDAV